MIASGHNAIGTTVGLVVATYTNDPIPAFLAAVSFGLVFHYLADFVPHGHIISNKEFGNLPPLLFLDLFGSFLIFYSFTLLKFGFSHTSLIVLIAIGASLLPDVVEGLLYFKKIPKIGIIRWENSMHQYLFHWHGHHEKALMWAITRDSWQISIVILSLLFLILT